MLPALLPPRIANCSRTLEPPSCAPHQYLRVILGGNPGPGVESRFRAPLPLAWCKVGVLRCRRWQRHSPQIVAQTEPFSRPAICISRCAAKVAKNLFANGSLLMDGAADAIPLEDQQRFPHRRASSPRRRLSICKGTVGRYGTSCTLEQSTLGESGATQGGFLNPPLAEDDDDDDDGDGDGDGDSHGVRYLHLYQEVL